MLEVTSIDWDRGRSRIENPRTNKVGYVLKLPWLWFRIKWFIRHDPRKHGGNMSTGRVGTSTAVITDSNRGPIIPAIIAEAEEWAAKRFLDYFTAAIRMKVEDYYSEGRRDCLRLYERAGKRHEVPAHHNAEKYLVTYVAAARIAADKTSPLFRSAAGRTRQLTDRSMDPNDALRMIKRRAKIIGLSDTICCHTFRATGISAFLENGGSIEKAKAIANHEGPKTTKLSSATGDQITLEDVERIII